MKKNKVLIKQYVLKNQQIEIMLESLFFISIHSKIQIYGTTT